MNCVIVDYGMGNLRSIQHKLKRAEISAAISSSAREVEAADLLILPGVGHFAQGMRNLKESGLLDVLHRRVVEEKTPVLGICLGMQLFTRHSEEGDVEGLGWINATTRRFRFDGFSPCPRVPHVGWNTVKPAQESALFEGVAPGQRFYFVHSYYVCCDDAADVLGTTLYGYEFASCVHRGNIFGTQFHPEKSHREGMRIISNFVGHCAAGVSA